MVDISQLFYNGYNGSYATEEEQQILTRYFGIDRTGTDGTGITEFTYINATDSYILSHGDTNYILPQFTDGSWYGKTQAILRYHNYSGPHEIILEKQKDRWIVLSNMPIVENMG